VRSRDGCAANAAAGRSESSRAVVMADGSCLLMRGSRLGSDARRASAGDMALFHMPATKSGAGTAAATAASSASSSDVVASAAGTATLQRVRQPAGDVTV
jgi:hypothetical protein